MGLSSRLLIENEIIFCGMYIFFKLLRTLDYRISILNRMEENAKFIGRQSWVNKESIPKLNPTSLFVLVVHTCTHRRFVVKLSARNSIWKN